MFFERGRCGGKTNIKKKYVLTSLNETNSLKILDNKFCVYKKYKTINTNTKLFYFKLSSNHAVLTFNFKTSVASLVKYMAGPRVGEASDRSGPGFSYIINHLTMTLLLE